MSFRLGPVAHPKTSTMHSRTMRIFIVCLICCVPCLAAQVEIAVTGANGAALKDALVIVQDLQGKDDRELFRALTDVRGNIPPHTLAPGVYRAIAVFPYSHRENSVSEFLVRDAPVNLHLRMAESQGLDDLPVSIGQLTVHVISPNGQPAVGARVLVCDAEAHPDSEHWGTTNAQGSTTLELNLTPAVLVVVYRDQLYTFPADSYETQRTLRLK